MMPRRLLSKASGSPVVQLMERHRPAGEGAVTEFDRLFQVGFEASVHALIDAIEFNTPQPSYGEDVDHSAELFEGLQSLTEAWLKRWNTHSRSLRLSSLEKATDKKRWETLVDFIKRYGRDLYTPKFLNLGNLRAVLHQRVDTYLRRLEEDDDAEARPALLDALDRDIPPPGRRLAKHRDQISSRITPSSRLQQHDDAERSGTLYPARFPRLRSATSVSRGTCGR
jgi:hypothetical protein